MKAIWITFIITIYFNTVILNNFLIARVSSIYENFQNTSILSENRNKITLIKEFLMYKHFFSKIGMSQMKTFNMMWMFQHKDSDSTNESWEGTVKTIKKHVTSQIQDLKSKLYKFATKLEEEIQGVITKVEAITTKVEEEIQGVTTKVETINTKIDFTKLEIITATKKEIETKIEATKQEI
jgi:hypothetical protein